MFEGVRMDTADTKAQAEVIADRYKKELRRLGYASSEGGKVCQ